MATMVVEIYDALRSIGVAEDKATKAAEAMATLEPQFTAMRQEYRDEFAATRQEYRDEFAAMRQEYRTGTTAMRQEYTAEFASVRADLRLVKWQVALLYAITGPTLLLLLRVAAKVGAFG